MVTLVNGEVTYPEPLSKVDVYIHHGLMLHGLMLLRNNPEFIKVPDRVYTSPESKEQAPCRLTHLVVVRVLHLLLSEE